MWDFLTIVFSSSLDFVILSWTPMGQEIMQVLKFIILFQHVLLDLLLLLLMTWNKFVLLKNNVDVVADYLILKRI
jgi:hypothetical protein